MRFVRLVVTDPGIDDYARIPEFESLCLMSVQTISLRAEFQCPINASDEWKC